MLILIDLLIGSIGRRVGRGKSKKLAQELIAMMIRKYRFAPYVHGKSLLLPRHGLCGSHCQPPH
ncbi:MAG: hypothetical protein NTW03_02375 [Verrucomicrobia bacterium]|nr:hypothetical protein [Verrucomicrobiota bacterium]